MAKGKAQEGDFSFVGGVNSMLSPDLLSPGYFSRACNIVTRGGIPQTRPGYRCKFVLPNGRPQGGTIFRPRNSPAVFVFAVDGLIYISEQPFTTYRQLEGVEFSSSAAMLYFQQAEQSTQLNGDSSISFINPRDLLIIQDGGTARPAVFDGTTIGQTSNIPLGGPMAWSGGRLWVARDTFLYASDLSNPIAFTDYLTISGASKNFTLPSRINALSEVPSAASAQLLAFTDTTTTHFQSGIRARALWALTPDFQKVIFPEIGCVANRSVIAHHGQLWWYCLTGLTSVDSAAQANLSSRLPYNDSEMTDSKAQLSADLSGIACSSFENYLLVSVPNSDKCNTHTWVLDHTPVEIEGPAAWNSFWTGTRPIEWLSGAIDGTNRSLFISADYDGSTRLWEAFTPDRRDSGCPITCYVETRGLNLQFPAKLKEFRYSDIFLTELSGRVDAAAFYAGAVRGKYKRILTKQIIASRGTFRSGETITADSTKIFALKKQSRPLRTQDGRALSEHDTLSSCGVESPNAEFKDESFQLLVVWSGCAALRGFVAYAEPPDNDDDSGRCEENETEENFVRFDGAAAEAAEFAAALAEFNAEIPLFTSTRTETVSADGFTEVATGMAESIISQSNADYVATTIARRKASAALERAMPKIVSIGAAANEI